MASPGDELFNPATGQRLVFRRTTAETNGELVEVESYYRAGGPPAPQHYHPSQDERFEVVSGVVHAVIGGETRRLTEGEVIEIPAGTPHEFGGIADADGHVIWQTRPALRTEQFFETVFGLAAAGRVGDDGVPGLLQLALMVPEFDAEIRVTKPPRAVQKLVFGALGPLARLRGYRATYPP